ncbi:nitrogenase stabilizing/protective protein NifW [Telmatospirillum sp. J64-1]|uniref:nitrogenase stabilizing/protective protein NifW n=1 Tax=Telmatospirillum sp. J64-1 TaxID=2502183 RepID=UPI00115EDF3D|nr:nitrogenase stabilizing/protective protein NifW [Telmatospirillum sp. J64-1]
MSGFKQQIAKLSSAEEFFDFLGVPYDPRVVSVNRLHILKRFHDYLALDANLEEAGEETLRKVYRSLLESAYQDFVRSDAVTEKVFKVFRQAQATQLGGQGFVPLSDLSRS